ncbi:DUF6191 domain-containing protein [Streptomyces roseolus]|uniref:DUF6191 domain-containing protein n=1 Tax=Streptomyces roseolus TaxID=67358 RepID=UPI00198363B3|nr:DUF6191 domain-containing protein [Streptomyces roseolus]GGR32193.1 hypothetical protein GCM10010282_25740 [Streptomyces roseolus]
MGAFGGLDAFFAPGRRHAAEERRRLALAREDPGAADPARGPVDPASGRVGSGRVGSGRVGSGRVGSGRVGSGRVTIRVPGPDAASAGGGEEVEPVGEGGGLAPAGDAQLGEDVGDVDARRLG